jgi:hypothetical protein
MFSFGFGSGEFGLIFGFGSGEFGLIFGFGSGEFGLIRFFGLKLALASSEASILALVRSA